MNARLGAPWRIAVSCAPSRRTRPAQRFTWGARPTTVVLSGRNLYKSTNYTGTDPESADQGVSTFSRRDYYIFPAPRTVLLTIRTGF